MAKTFIVGRDGFLGRHFFDVYQNLDSGLFGTQRQWPEKPFYLDLEHPDLSFLPLEGHEYTHAIITAASSQLMGCEKTPDKTLRVNVEGTLALAKALAARKITPVLFSTSYVFDGVSGGYREESATSPLNAYGIQKAILEQRIDQACEGNYLLLRLSKVFSLQRRDGTLFDEMAAKLIQGEPIQVAYDQILAPIWVDDVVRITHHLQKMGARGLFNLCGNEISSRLELGLRMAHLLSKDPGLVQKISLDDLQDTIQRPKRNDLCCDKVIATGIVPPRPIEACMQEIANRWNARTQS